MSASIMQRIKGKNDRDNSKKVPEAEQLFELIVKAAKCGDLGLNGDKLVVTQFSDSSFGFRVVAQLIKGGQYMVKFPSK